jgi:hypothetical protein
MTPEEHLAWAKARAQELLDRGDVVQAVSSMISDLAKHEAFRELRPSAAIAGTEELLEHAKRGGALPVAEVQAWLDGIRPPDGA